VALNEATVLGAEVDTTRRLVAVTFSVLTLPPDGPSPEDSRVQFVFENVGRVAISLRNGQWNDAHAKVERVELSQLSEVVESFKSEIYGWQYFDQEEEFQNWKDRLSLDHIFAEGGRSHSITLFQERFCEVDRHLDIRIWFDTVELRNASGDVLDMDKFIAGGERWWEAMYRGVQRVRGKGISPLKPQ
jgi:hypothetical protein